MNFAIKITANVNGYIQYLSKIEILSRREPSKRVIQEKAKTAKYKLCFRIYLRRISGKNKEKREKF